MSRPIIITKEDLGIQDRSPHYPRKVKTYQHFFINSCNLLFSQNKLIAFVKEIEINFAVIDYLNSEYLFTDEDVCKTHLAWAKKDLKKYCKPNKDKFNKNIRKTLALNIYEKEGVSK
mgnify:FL=1|tara:strand:+ start:268 stop:618 length:351 start_codon:yes stop_codon:yes gene_type:complete